ncbi:amidohydrolase family protein [soil metagenome]
MVEGDEIVSVGPWEGNEGGQMEDLGEVILMPGLINAHCHLDYSGMRGAILFSGSFSAWVRRINELKRTQTDDDYLGAIATGFRELRRNGTTGVFNIESFPELMVRMPAPPIRTWWFYELMDIRSRIHTDDVVAGALAFFEASKDWLGGFGLSPHAPYTTSLELYELIRDCCERYEMPMMTHLAETPEEFEMFSKSSGSLYEFLSGIGRDMGDTGGVSPVRHLLQNNVLPKDAILTHMNVLEDSDWDLLRERKSAISVVHCPNCHEYFGRERFPLEKFQAESINLCLGTDSLASNRSLNLFEEMRTVSKIHPEVSASDLLDMVTRNAARAVGMGGKLGVLCPGAKADLIAIPYGGEAKNALSGIVEYRGPIDWMMVNGSLVGDF